MMTPAGFAEPEAILAKGREVAIPAAWGDILAAALAFIALIALYQKWSFAIPLVWLFSIIGLLDLVNVMRLVVTRGVDPGHLGSIYLIVVVIVPGLLLTHFEVFGLLRRGEING